jgi:hypothetical protein
MHAAEPAVAVEAPPRRRQTSGPEVFDRPIEAMMTAEEMDETAGVWAGLGFEDGDAWP